MTLRRLRLFAILAPASLLLHELAYAIVGGGLLGSHGYLELLLPLSAALAGSVAFASLVAPALGVPGEDRHQPYAPLALAGSLLGIFMIQELTEALLLGGGAEGFAASASAAWLAPPLALLLGALGAGLIIALERTGRLLGQAPELRHPPFPRMEGAAAEHRGPDLALPAGAGLSFGFARRPPPASA